MMAVSVRMDALLEQELEAAARRQGLSKSQFIVDAVERALGRKNPYELLLKVERELAPLRAAEEKAKRRREPLHDDGSMSARYREALRMKHEANLRDWEVHHAKNAPAVKRAAAKTSSSRKKA
jgi:predicted DNA-binding protein